MHSFNGGRGEQGPVDESAVMHKKDLAGEVALAGSLATVESVLA